MLSLQPNVEIRVYRAGDERKPLREFRTRNRFLDAGWRQYRDLVLYRSLPAGGLATPDYIAVGTSSLATTDGMLALTNEVARKKVARRIALDDSVWKYTVRFEPSEANGPTGTQILREFGLLTLSSGGDLWARTVAPPITKNSGLAVTVDWTFTGATV